MKLAVVLVFLLGISYVYNTQTEAEVQSQLEQFDQDEFGRTLLDTIQLQLEAKEPVDKLVKQLAYIESQLQSDQRSADRRHSKYQDKCDADIRAFEEEIQRNKQRATDLRNEIAIKKPILAQKRQQKADKTTQTVKTMKEIARAQAQRKNEGREFERKVKEHEYASFVIGEAKKIFDKTFKGGKGSLLEVDEESFLQLSGHFQKYMNSDYFQERESYGYFFKILAQITSSKQLKAKSGMVGRVYKLFDLLLAKIEDSLTVERKAEEKRIFLFKRYKAQLEKEIARLQREIARLNVEIIALDNRIKEATKDLTETLQRIKIKTQQMNDRIRECDDEAEAYKNERVKRNVKQNIVSALIGLIQSKLRSIRTFTKSRSR